MFLLLFPLVLAAANDPGHDTLYLEEVGDSELTGALNITANLTVSGDTAVNYLTFYGDGTISTDASITAESGSPFRMYIDTQGDIHIKYAGGDQVVIGALGLTNLNVSGNIYSGNKLVCLADGTNCVGGNNTGNVSSVTAGSGLTDSGTASDPIIDINLDTGSGLAINSDALGMIRTCGDGQLLKWNNTATAWECESDLDSAVSEATVESYIYDAANVLGAQWTVTSDGTYDINFDSNTFVVDASEGRVGIGLAAPSKALEVSDGSKGITFDPSPTSPTINTTSGNLTIDSAGGYVIINLG